MEVILPFDDGTCVGLKAADFDDYKIPAPPNAHAKGEDGTFKLIFNDSEEAIKYAIHLNDVYERMEASSEYECSRQKIKLIISAVNEQADFKSLNFDS